MRSRHALVFTLVLALALVVVATVGAVNWIVTCSQSHVNNDDPIVSPAQPGASHTHLFAGSRGTNAHSTPDSMRASGTTCGMPGDTAGYWIPKPLNYNLHQNGGMLAYYVFGSSARAFPDGLKMVVGNAKATSEATNPAIAQRNLTFKCGPGSNTETSRPPASCSSGMLVMVVTFPRYWRGQALDSADHLSHMSYSRCSGCVEVPRVKVYVRIGVPKGAPIDFTLSSGPYYTAHMDFFATWIPSELERMMSQCAGRNCGTNPN